ncbi:hypothetical protein IFT91_27625 [Pseudomonas fluorescens]|nr:hypothetical protein [Pseudomonas fluorescens]
MNNQQVDLTFGQPSRARLNLAKLLPFEQYENNCDIPPEWIDLEDVELIWWIVASRISKKELRNRLRKIADSYQDCGCFAFAVVADGNGRGRYPRGVVNTLRSILQPRKLMWRHPTEDVLRIQMVIWHLCISAALDWCPAEALPMRLQSLKFEKALD